MILIPFFGHALYPLSENKEDHEQILNSDISFEFGCNVIRKILTLSLNMAKMFSLSSLGGISFMRRIKSYTRILLARNLFILADIALDPRK